MDDIGQSALIGVWKIIIDVSAYENNLNQDVNITSIQKQIDRNDKTEYWPTSIK